VRGGTIDSNIFFGKPTRMGYNIGGMEIRCLSCHPEPQRRIS
jgi:hypothetical protein